MALPRKASKASLAITIFTAMLLMMMICADAAPDFQKLGRRFLEVSVQQDYPGSYGTGWGAFLPPTHP
ncbi:hypothetical protein CRG98_022113 [Punica granatum]|nr:hypothetical protein CRG98_022113 [Punica granatum]